MSTKRHCFACDLKDNSKLMAEYKEYHAKGKVWPEVTQSIKDAGIVDLQIYLIKNRMFMIMEVDDSFDPVKKAAMDEANPKVQEWETLMWKFQHPLPWAKPGEKWLPMEPVFKLEDQ